MKTVTRKSATGPNAGPGSGGGPASTRAVASSDVRNRLGSWDRRLSSTLVLVVAMGVVIAGQLAEDLADSPPVQMLPPIFSGRRWTLIATVLYMLVISRLVDRTVQRSLPSLERVLRIDAPAFRGYVERMRPPDRVVSLVLLAASALLVAGLFVGAGADLPLTNDPVTGLPIYLPGNGASALVILAGYTVVGWAGLSLVYLTIRLGRALGQLSRESLAVDVFDTTNLLPFGNIALAGALAPAGIIVILLVGLGQPSTWGSWAVLLLAAVASVLALLLPLRGIHRQMSDAKDLVLANLNARLSQVYDEVNRTAIDGAAPAGLNERTSTLIPLRATVHQMTTWPFADTVAFGRAVLIASAPLIYTILSELIRIFWIEPLSP